MSDEPIMISGEDNVRVASWLSVRAMLHLETKGMRRSRGKSARQLANQITGQNHRTAVKAYEALNAHIVAALGESFNRPL